jgi:2-dehydro-3-deoxyphosphogluconate aldolase / (4S)-4-hydroxy-2-oxoglutarate aldolase
MDSRALVDRLKQIAVVPIIRTADWGLAIRAVEAVIAGGIPCVEITMTVDGAIKALEAVADRYGDRIILGAGTVLDPETARACMLAGAQFFVTPSLNTRTIEMAKRYSKPIFPGALTPTEILTAWEAGADGVKVFPCSALGGAKYIKALKGPFPQIELVPTGGVNLQTITEFLEAGASAVGVGGELIDQSSCASGNYAEITRRAQQFRDAVQAARAA